MNREEQLMARDREFCALAQTKGERAWQTMMMKDVLMGTAGDHPYLEGWDAIGPGLQALYQLPSLRFGWEPKHAFVSHDATLGVTTGTYERTYLRDGIPVRQVGKYVTVWERRDSDWWVRFDMGN